jgi:glyoxylase-like metal-dependent hydrolase (beta-lactamase superfamily II)
LKERTVPLLPIAGPAHIVPGRVNIGVILGQGEAALIDTGLDENGARKALQAVEQAGARVTAILNTHAHADHCGGNAFVRKRTGATTYAPPIEAALIAHPEIEPWYLFGAAPFPAIDTKWFHADASPVEHLLKDSVQLCGVALEILPTPGHSIGQVAVLTPEVAFLGDALVAPELLERYPIQYVYDVLMHRETLKQFPALRQPWCVGAHFPPTRDLEGLLAANLRNLERTAQAVWDALASTASTEEVVARTAEALGVLSMEPSSYLLNAAAIKAHLSAFAREGRAAFRIDDGRPTWQRIE